MCRKHGISDATFYNWKAKFGGMAVSGRPTAGARDDGAARERLRAIANERRRFGYRRLAIMLRREGKTMNLKKIYRLYREERLTVRKRGGRSRALGTRAPMTLPQGVNQRWSLAVLIASVASAAPPPPPAPDDVVVTRQFIGSLVTKNVAEYASVLADDVEVTEEGRWLAHSKAQWMTLFTPELLRASRRVTSDGVWIGFDYSAKKDKGTLDQVMIVERIDQVFGDCCVYRRSEILTLKNGKIVNLDLSRSFDLQLQMMADGRKIGKAALRSSVTKS